MSSRPASSASFFLGSPYFMVGCSVGQTIHRSSVLSIELVRSHHNYMSYCIDNLLCREVKRYGLEPPRVVQPLFSRGHPKHNEWNVRRATLCWMGVRQEFPRYTGVSRACYGAGLINSSEIVERSVRRVRNERCRDAGRQWVVGR